MSVDILQFKEFVDLHCISTTWIYLGTSIYQTAKGLPINMFAITRFPYTVWRFSFIYLTIKKPMPKNVVFKNLFSLKFETGSYFLKQMLNKFCTLG